jgi:hypothetical protein
LYASVGIDGGFDNNEADYEETHNIVILPDYVSLSYPSVELPEKVFVAHCFWFFLCSFTAEFDSKRSLMPGRF